MPTEELKQQAEGFLMGTYSRQPISIVRGRGTKVYDLEGREYTDFVGGIAVNILGYGHPDLVAAIQRQAVTDELTGLLDDELYALNARLGESTFPRTAGAYLDEWAAPERAWLRKYYPPGSDEAHYDATPASLGRITLASSEGEAPTFHVAIPIRAVRAEPAADAVIAS